MIKRWHILILLVIGLIYQSCEITLDPPETEFFVGRVWRMEKVQVGQIEEYTEGLDNYRLILNDSTDEFVEIREGLPESDNSDISIPIDNGTWSLNSTGSELILDREVSGIVERWAIIELGLRKMRIERILGNGKTGALSTTYFLEAVPQ